MRARIAEMHDSNSKSDNRVREQVRREFSSAMRKLFSLSFEQKSRIDEYRNHLHSVTLQRISEVRDEASAEMARIKEKSGARASAGKLRLNEPPFLNRVSSQLCDLAVMHAISN